MQNSHQRNMINDVHTIYPFKLQAHDADLYPNPNCSKHNLRPQWEDTFKYHLHHDLCTPAAVSFDSSLVKPLVCLLGYTPQMATNNTSPLG
jgi:hypothetical protein